MPVTATARDNARTLLRHRRVYNQALARAALVGPPRPERHAELRDACMLAATARSALRRAGTEHPAAVKVACAVRSDVMQRRQGVGMADLEACVTELGALRRDTDAMLARRHASLAALAAESSYVRACLVASCVNHSVLGAGAGGDGCLAVPRRAALGPVVRAIAPVMSAVTCSRLPACAALVQARFSGGAEGIRVLGATRIHNQLAEAAFETALQRCG